MNNIFSQAVSLMNQMSYRKKFSLLGVISLMAIGVLIYSLFLGLNKVVENAQGQLQGLEIISPLSSVIRLTQKHRSLSADFLAGKRKLIDATTRNETKIDKKISQIEKLLPADLSTNTNWIKIINNWNNIVNNGFKHSAKHNFNKHTALLKQMLYFQSLIADEYALTFDPNIDTYYLIDTSINKLPAAIEQLAQVRVYSTSILAKKQASEFQEANMIALITRLEIALEQLQSNLKKTAYYNKAISSQLFHASSDITRSVQKIIRRLQLDILEKRFISGHDNFIVNVMAAIDKSYNEMYNILLPATKILITKHLQHAQDILHISIGISLILMMMVLYFGFAIYYSMTRNIQSLSQSLQLFAEGDLNKRINLGTQDELDLIGDSFNTLAEEITTLLEKTELSQKKLKQVLDGLLTMAAVVWPDGTLDFANSTPLKLADISLKDIMGKKLWDTPWFSYNAQIQQLIQRDCESAAQGETIEREIEFATSGHKIWVDFSIHPVLDEKHQVKLLVVEARDATRRRLAEEHSKRSQKMEALGKVVGGIAHDYNNMLGVILGYAELMEIKCENQHDVSNYINEIIRAGERGRTLTRKMLVFSKQESSNPARYQINQLLLDLKDMLAKSLTASIKLSYQLCENDWPVWIDASDLEDTILNLAINAKYAMPDGGSLLIQTENCHLAQKEAGLLGLTANDYLKLSLTDNGCGINEQTKSHIFDPFFTTKGDAGTGLGLSQVFSFVERSGGVINVYSELNKGTQFTLYFPRFHADPYQIKSFDEISEPQLTGAECILVVDDEPALRELASQILTHFGYKVLTANCAKAALNILASEPVELMLSDVIMPNIDGYELARKVSQQYPQVKIQLASGFSDNRHTEYELHLKKKMLHKPYSSKELLSCIRSLLDEQDNHEGDTQ